MSYAKSKGVPIWSADDWLRFTKARAGTAFGTPTWDGQHLTFTMTVPSGPDAMPLMVPTVATGSLTGITLDGSAATSQTRTVKGADSAVVEVPAGTHTIVATYNGTILPTSTPTSTASGTTTTTPTNTPTNTPTATATGTGTATGTPPPNVMVGSSTIGDLSDANGPGVAEAFSYTASISGAINSLSVYLDSLSNATKVTVGLYADSAGSPGALLTQGTITSPVAGAWNTVNVSTASIIAGNPYWIALLSPAGAGTVRFTDTSSGGAAAASAQTNLTTLPATWTTGTQYANSPLSAYASGIPGTVTPTPTGTPTSTPTSTPTGTPTSTPTPAPTSTPTAPGQFVQNAAQFGQGTQNGVALGADSNLSLVPALSDDFTGTTLNGATWSTSIWGSGGNAAVSNGAVTVDGAGVASRQTFTQRTFEARALFTAGPPAYQNIGWSPDMSSSWLLIGEPGYDPAHVYARVNTGSTAEQLVQLPVTLGSYHTYKIVWGASQIDFYVDGTLATSINAVLNNPMAEWISSGAFGHPLTVDWMRALQYAPTSGTYTSNVLDAGASTPWQALTWVGAVPSGATLTGQTRTSADAATWSAYQPLGAGGAIASPAGRYLQYQLSLGGSATLSPSITSVTVSFGTGGTPTPTPTPTSTPTGTPTATPAPTSTPTAPGQFVQDTTQFALGTLNGVTDGVDSNLSLVPALSDDFTGTTLNSALWATTVWGSGGNATVSNGSVAVDAAGIATKQTFTQRTFEARVLFTAGPPAFQNLGWSPDLNSQWILVGEPGGDPTHVYARVNTGVGSEQLVQLPVTLGSYHTYKIVWGASQIDFYVDNTLATSITATLNNPMPTWASSGALGHPLTVDWARVLQYAPTSGTYTSNVLDAGASTPWQALTWVGAVPSGATLTGQTRTSADAATWSAYQPLGAGGAIASPAGRYLQYQLSLGGSATLSPSVTSVTVSFGSGGGGAPVSRNVSSVQTQPSAATVAHPPTITTIAPSSGSTAGGTTVTITGTGFAAGATVVFDGTHATNVTVVSATEITVTAPAHAQSGPVDVTVFVGTQGAALLHGYTYATAGASPSSVPSVAPAPRSSAPAPPPVGGAGASGQPAPIPGGRP